MPSLTRTLKNNAVHMLARMGYSVRRLAPEDRRYLNSSHDPDSPLPDDAHEALHTDHPRLAELRAAYAALDLPAVCAHTLWDSKHLAPELNLPWFRGDNAYVWQYRQLRSEIRMKQYLMLCDVEARDELGLLKRLDEDGAFGCWTSRYGERAPISRDLLESVAEINYLNQHLGIADTPNLQVLDIGAGYGRLGYRMSQALPNLQRYDCVDAVAESTYLCEYYLNYRGVTDRARAVPLHQLNNLAAPGGYHLAVNIHSFSECRRVAIRWWLDLLVRLRVPYLLIIPNHPEQLLSYESLDKREDFAPDVAAAGYQLMHHAPVFADDELRQMIGVRDHFYLYKLEDK